jgi:uncharacterized protein
MLGRLATWLRVLGFDCAFAREGPDGPMVQRAREQGRVLLTRDTGILERAGLPELVFVRSDQLRDQLVQVLRDARLLPLLKPHSRCVRCNQPLVPAPPELVTSQVPPYVQATCRRFRLCPTCGRIFWPGTHKAMMDREIDELVARARRHD